MSSTIATLIKSYRFNLQYAEKLVGDLDDEMMVKTPSVGLENHPAWTLGHLASAAALMVKYLGGPYNFDPEWEKLFRRKGPGDPRRPEERIDLYPGKTELLAELSRLHTSVEELITDLDESRWDETVKWRFDKHLPTMRDLLYFMCLTHEAMHLSQLAAWRRAMGLDSALAQL